MNIPRIGLGVDVHRLETGRRCRLGGIEIESPVGPVGHSDGDAVLHALCDAVLGAAGLDDLGSLFPDSAPENAGRDSREFCQAAVLAVHGQGMRVVSLDVVVETDHPRLVAHRAAMREQIARLFALSADRINIKGKTGERIGEIGAGRALRATAIALLM